MPPLNISASTFYLDNTGFPYPEIPYTDEADLVFTNITNAQATWHALSGDIIIVQNTNAAPRGVTLIPIVNDRGRIGALDLDYEVPANGFIILGPLALDGWVQVSVPPHAYVEADTSDDPYLNVAVVHPRL
jgi:hypothetical protein